MTRRHRDQTFRKNDLVRVLRAAQTAGLANPRVEIDTTRRTISIIPGEPTNNVITDGATAQMNDLDRELELFKVRHGEG
jgi:hypothetical protein